MADPYGLTQSGIDPALQAEMRGLTRQQAIQEALLKQSMMPAGGVIDAGHFKVARSPLEGLGKVAQAYMARQGLNESDKKFADLRLRQDQMTADEVRRYQQMKTGTPEVPATPAVTDVAQTNQSMDTFDPQAAVAGQAAVPGNARGAIEMAMLSRNPALQRLGAMDSSQQQAKDIQQANLEQRIWETQEKGKDRLLQIQESAAQGRITKAEADARMAELKRELQASQAQSARELRVLGGQIAAAGRQPQAPIAVMVDGKPVFVSPQEAIGKQPASKSSGGMSATAQKELIQTDEEVQGGKQALEYIKAAKNLNEKAMGGFGSSAIATAGTILPNRLRPQTIDDTRELDNILQSSALPQLKAIFGGMPTEGERKILLEVQGSSGQTAEVRKGIFDRAEKAVNARLKFAQDKSKSLRSGNYFAGDGGLDAAPAAPSGGGNLTPQEQAELDQLRARLKK